MYTSSDVEDDGFYDYYISRGLCGIGPINKQEFSILDAINIGLAPKSRGNARSVLWAVCMSLSTIWTGSKFKIHY